MFYRSILNRSILLNIIRKIHANRITVSYKKGDRYIKIESNTQSVLIESYNAEIDWVGVFSTYYELSNTGLEIIIVDTMGHTCYHEIDDKIQYFVAGVRLWKCIHLYTSEQIEEYVKENPMPHNPVRFF